MRISKMRIDRFGVWTDLELADFSPELNVVYGPAGSGKSTVAQFLRSVLFGFSDETRRRFVAAESFGIGGSLVVKEREQQRTIRRHADGVRGDRLVVEDQTGMVIGKHHVSDLTGRLRPSAFDRVYFPRHQNHRDISALVESAIAQGFDLIGGHGDATQLEILKQKLVDAIRSRDETPAIESSLEDLTERKHRLELEIEALTISIERERSTRGVRLQQLTAELHELETELAELRRELDSLDAEIEAREADRRSWEERIREARREKELAIAEYRQQLEEIDQQLARWQSVLQDIHTRSADLSEHHDAAELSDRAFVADPRRFLGRIENQIDGLQQVVTELENDRTAGSCQCQELRVVLEPVLRSMREDVYRLCNELSQWEIKTQRTETHSEMTQLERCESELRQAMQGLSLRRQELLVRLDELHDGGFRTVENNHSRLCQCTEHPELLESIRYASENYSLDDEHLALLKTEVDRLLERREGVLRDIDAVQQVLRDVRDQHQRIQLTNNDQSDCLASRKLELEDVQAQILHVKRRLELNETIERLESETRVIQAAVRQPQLLREASELLGRLTRGRSSRISVTPDHRVWVADRSGHRQTPEQLETVACRRIHLSLALAVVAAFARRNTRLPMILDDQLLAGDQVDLEAVVSVLHDFSRHGYQMFVFTQHRSLANAFRAAQTRVFDLPSYTVVKTVEPEREPVVVRHVERDWTEVNRRLHTIAEETVTPTDECDRPAWDGEEFPGELTDRVTQAKNQEPIIVEIDDNESDYFLWEHSPIQDAPSIDAATAERFRKIGVMLVRDLLRIDIAHAATQLRHTGITASMIRRWRSEALLVCRIPRLRPYDARILVECGIGDPRQLSQLDAESLRNRVETFAATEKGQTLIQAGDRYELSRLTDWIDASRGRRGASIIDRRVTSITAPQRNVDNRAWERQRADTNNDTHSRWSTESSPTGQRDTIAFKLDSDASEDDDLRFYLSTSDPLEAAPSIGPQTAERFERIGIRTVADFLRTDADWMSRRLSHRRINAATIVDWQKQAILVCRTPFLRGHDAQLLVACGIDDADALANMNASALWSKIGPLADSREGKRIIRNGKAPDLTEVKDWISWASQARQLRAA